MKTKLYTTILFLIFETNIYSQKRKIPEYFEYLSKLELNYSYESFETPTVYFNSEETIIINKKVDSTSVFYEEYTDGILLHEFISTSITKSKKEKYTIFFDYGMSADPNFSIVKVKGDSIKHIGSFGGLTLYIPGNGNLYVEGHTNNYYNTRKKYQLKNDQLIEIKQPFYYVGITARTKGLMKLYSDEKLENSVAILPKGAEIEILLNDNDYCFDPYKTRVIF